MKLGERERWREYQKLKMAYFGVGYFRNPKGSSQEGCSCHCH